MGLHISFLLKPFSKSHILSVTANDCEKHASMFQIFGWLFPVPGLYWVLCNMGMLSDTWNSLKLHYVSSALGVIQLKYQEPDIEYNPMHLWNESFPLGCLKCIWQSNIWWHELNKNVKRRCLMVKRLKQYDCTLFKFTAISHQILLPLLASIVYTIQTWNLW